VIRWILETKWKPELILAVSVFLLLGSVDLVTGDWLRLSVSAIYSASLLFLRKFSYLTGALLISCALVHAVYAVPPTFRDFALALTVFGIAIFTSRPWRLMNLIVATATALVLMGNAAYNTSLSFPELGVIEFTETGRSVLFVSGAILACSLIAASWLAGRLVQTKYLQSEFQKNRKYSNAQQDEISLDLAEQAKRFEMAGDMNESAIQHVSSVIVNAEAGLYTGKLDASSGTRALEKILTEAKQAHGELRRLYETINRGSLASSAPPTLESIKTLELDMREAGYNMTVIYTGAVTSLGSSMELAIYRIVLEALKNVRQHNPKGTSVTVELTWFESNLQVIIKDNGVEVTRKSAAAEQGVPKSYDAKEDLQSLLEKVVGPGITAMRERVQSFGGSLEAQRAIGIGFTVSALFPIPSGNRD
jgi:signal transduction histidine kinase